MVKEVNNMTRGVHLALILSVALVSNGCVLGYLVEYLLWPPPCHLCDKRTNVLTQDEADKRNDPDWKILKEPTSVLPHDHR